MDTYYPYLNLYLGASCGSGKAFVKSIFNAPLVTVASLL